jgi:hypothetical protein
MKAGNINLFVLSSLIILVTIFGFTINNPSINENTDECKYISEDTVTTWHERINSFPYTVYKNFDDIPFPKHLIEDELPYPNDKHIVFNFGFSDGPEQSFYLFAVIGRGLLDDDRFKFDYSTLIYYSKTQNTWVPAKKQFMVESKVNWEVIVQKFELLPTIAYIVPNVDLNVCAHKSFDRIRFGIDLHADEYYKLRLYFHEESTEENPVPTNFDACTPCPPICKDDELE